MMSKNAPSLIDLVQLAGQRAREIEAEAVDVHLQHPVAQAVHDQLQHARVRMLSVLPQPVKSM